MSPFNHDTGAPLSSPFLEGHRDVSVLYVIRLRSTTQRPLRYTEEEKTILRVHSAPQKPREMNPFRPPDRDPSDPITTKRETQNGTAHCAYWYAAKPNTKVNFT